VLECGEKEADVEGRRVCRMRKRNKRQDKKKAIKKCKDITI
jgi:hypothetical protein